MRDAPTYIVELRPERQRTEEQTLRDLRSLLKRLLRSGNLRCLSIKEARK